MKNQGDKYILGLDAATTKTGYSILDYNSNVIDCDLIRTTSSDTKERMLEIYNTIENIIYKYNIGAIVLEDVPVNTHSNIKTGKDLSILQGVILALCFKNDITYHLYSPTQWRSIIEIYDGTREGTKREILKQKAVDKVNELYALDFIYNATETKTRFTDDDKAEAILIARAYLTDSKGQ